MNDRERFGEAALRVLRKPFVGHGKLEVLPKVMARSLDDIAIVYRSEAVAQSLVSRGLARKSPASGDVARHTRMLRELVAERQAFVATRTPGD